MIDWGCKTIEPDDLVPDIMPFILVDGAGDSQDDLEGLIAFQTLRAVQNLARETGALCCKVAADAQCSVTDYPIETPENFGFVGLKSVTVCGECYDPWTDDCKEPCGPYFWVDGDSIQLGKAPMSDEDDGIEYTISVAPDYESCEIPETFWRQHRDLIVDGVLSKLLGMPARSWSHPQMALYHRQQYQHGRNRAKSRRPDGMPNRCILKPQRWA